MKRFASTTLASVFAFSVSATCIEAADAPAPQHVAEAKPEKKAEGKPEKTAEGKTEKKAKGGKKKALEIGDGPLTAQMKADLKKRMRRQTQSGNIANLRITVKLALDKADKERDRDLLAVAHFYNAGLASTDGTDALFYDSIELAIANGNLNADGFENLALIPDSFKNAARFMARMEKLRKEATEILKAEFEKDVRSRLKNAQPETVSLPDGCGIGPNPLSPAAIVGKPAVLVVTPVNHDGFDKGAKSLATLAKEFDGKVVVAALFCQYDPADAKRRTATEAAIKSLGITLPTGLVGREFLKAFDIPFFPAYFFVGSDGKMPTRQNGFLEEGQLRFILGELAGLAKPPAEPPAAEKPPDEKKE